MEDCRIEGNTNKDMEVAPALVSVHPSQNFVAVAVGSDLRVFDVQAGSSVSLTDDSGAPHHKDSIRAICFNTDGKIFASAGDDKLIKIWATGSVWSCISTVCSEKRVTAVTISNDGFFACFSDKFGVVWVVSLDDCKDDKPSINKKAEPLLGHYCSIITSLKFSPDGRFIVSADRDFKIRVTMFPKKPLEGAHEIQSFCLGHSDFTDTFYASDESIKGYNVCLIICERNSRVSDINWFVTCLAFVGSSDYPQGFLVSGSGDSTVRMWDITSGSLLHTCELGEEAGLLDEEECSPAVTDLCTIPNGTLVAVAIQSLQGIMLLSCDLATKTLSVIKVISIKEEMFIPTSLAISSCEQLLWMVTGVSNLDHSNTPSFARVKVISCLTKNTMEFGQHEPLLLADKEIPGGEKLLEKLQGSVAIESKVFLAAAEAVKTAMCNLLIKKQYSTEKREFRKRSRNDRKSKK